MFEEKLKAIRARYEELNIFLSQPDAMADQAKWRDAIREQADISEIIEKMDERDRVAAELEQWEQASHGDDPELAELARQELPVLQQQHRELEEALQEMLIPKDPNDDKNVIMEIRAGTGGDEAGLFAADLYRMYSRYAELKRWKTELISSNETGIGGIKEVIFSIKGKGAFSRMKFESGVHRVQRVPETEAQGRIHTSTVTVAVLAEVDEVEIDIPDSDIQIDVFKSAGAGGQNVQKNMTAIRLTHIPTGMVVACQDERSQLQNKLRAMGILRARLYEIKLAKQNSEQDATRRSQIGSGERAEKIRTYNFPQSRITDHRINLSSYNLNGVLSGTELDYFINELRLTDEAERLATDYLRERGWFGDNNECEADYVL